ncbi:hypothetical protein ACUNWD_09980 [Sunxiuqinia sp. A32]|uniref:hypothetical protein n=1 Tax=Sunxiuqinia sp. A32 TaxID=3461496 RepID=UPI004045331D
MEKIYINEQKIEEILKNSKLSLKPIERFCKVLKEEGIDPNIEHLEGFIKDGPEYIKTELIKGAREDISKMKIKSEKLKKAFLNEAIAIDNQMYHNIHIEITASLRKCHIWIGDIDLHGQKPVLNKSYKDRINQQYTVTLELAEQKEFWEELQKLSESYNRLEVLAEKMGIESLNEHFDPNYFSWFKIETSGKYTRLQPDPSGFLK